MDFQQEIQYFSAVAYDGSTYNFTINQKGEISCVEFKMPFPASIIELKPNFVLRSSDGSSVCSLDDYLRSNNCKKPDGLSLISEWNINDEVFEYLIANRKLMYSTQMATLYGFDLNYAFDKNHNKRVFKSLRNKPDAKTRILAPQKQGKFN